MTLWRVGAKGTKKKGHDAHGLWTEMQPRGSYSSLRLPTLHELRRTDDTVTKYENQSFFLFALGSGNGLSRRHCARPQ